MRISVGTAKSLKTGEWVQLGLPFGSKPRLKRLPTRPEIRAFKDQLSRLATATIRMTMTTEDRVFQINNQVVSAFDLLIKDEHQRVLWSSVLRLSQDYFASLQTHAESLDELALGGLAYSTMAMALDLYAWLAQRLHRVPRRKPQFIAWAAFLLSSRWRWLQPRQGGNLRSRCDWYLRSRKRHCGRTDKLFNLCHRLVYKLI